MRLWHVPTLLPVVVSLSKYIFLRIWLYVGKKFVVLYKETLSNSTKFAIVFPLKTIIQVKSGSAFT